MKRVRCPVCGNLAEKRGAWKMPDGSRNRLYIHETKLGLFGCREVTNSCIANEPNDKPASGGN